MMSLEYGCRVLYSGLVLLLLSLLNYGAYFRATIFVGTSAAAKELKWGQIA